MRSTTMTGTADNLCHAAWQPEYEVRELSGDEPPVDLGVLHRCREFLDAADFTLDYLALHDPEREGHVGVLQIERVDGGGREVVAVYRARDAVAVGGGLAAHWGFPVTTWQGAPEVRRRR